MRNSTNEAETIDCRCNCIWGLNFSITNECDEMGWEVECKQEKQIKPLELNVIPQNII